jgi:hypothetical protein
VGHIFRTRREYRKIAYPGSCTWKSWCDWVTTSVLRDRHRAIHYPPPRRKTRASKRARST